MLKLFYEFLDVFRDVNKIDDLKIDALEDSGDGLIAKYRQVLDEVVNFKSTKKGFKTINREIASYEQT